MRLGGVRKEEEGRDHEMGLREGTWAVDLSLALRCSGVTAGEIELRAWVGGRVVSGDGRWVQVLGYGFVSGFASKQQP